VVPAAEWSGIPETPKAKEAGEQGRNQEPVRAPKGQSEGLRNVIVQNSVKKK
jgi:hypothetical protein